jgi:hypothetical protein
VLLSGGELLAVAKNLEGKADLETSPFLVRHKNTSVPNLSRTALPSGKAAGMEYER